MSCKPLKILRNVAPLECSQEGTGTVIIARDITFGGIVRFSASVIRQLRVVLPCTEFHSNSVLSPFTRMIVTMILPKSSLIIYIVFIYNVVGVSNNVDSVSKYSLEDNEIEFFKGNRTNRRTEHPHAHLTPVSDYPCFMGFF